MSIRERSTCSPRAAAISSTQRSTAESIPSPSRSIFSIPASAQESLSHWTIWRPAIAAGTTGQTSIRASVEITIPPECWEAWRGSPSASPPSSSSTRQRGAQVALQLARGLVEADRLRHLVDLLGRQAERLTEVADDAPRPVGREGGDQRRALGAVDLVDARDQHLADVAGEVEVDVRHRADPLAEEAAGEKVVLDRVDVREAGQVADDRADAGAAPAPRRQRPPRRRVA